MKHKLLWRTVAIVWLAAGMAVNAAESARESFDYPEAASLAEQTGGIGWNAAWYGDGQALAGSVHAGGLTWTDGAGNVLNVSGLAASTAGASTTRTFRTLTGGTVNNVWISFLWQLPAANSLFEGVTFYNGTQAVFSVSNPSTTTAASIVLGNSVTGAAANTGLGQFGVTHFIVLHLIKDGAPNGNDLLEIFVDPLLSAVPPAPATTVNAGAFDFNTLRVAGQNGAALYFDEFRLGSAYADVTPHLPANDGTGDPDSDGLTDAQEAQLGTNPLVSNAALFAAIRAHPRFFGLYESGNLLSPGQRGVVLPRGAANSVTLPLEVQHSATLLTWPVLESLTRQIELPAGKNFLRVTLPD